MPDLDVELESFESVVPGGLRRVTWLVLQSGKWIVVGDVPGARVERRDTGPGMVWLRRVTLALPIGAHLSRVESTPKRETPRDPFAYLLTPGPRGDRDTRRSYFSLRADGKLERLPGRPR